ncbi:uncharacterized protein LOC123424660 [Hordeum vulgare subsp. vulgare]|uniref:Predicted protein n=1 Tax=Hordeum vulgare subsp. vulgare TaxID=112509 RepID=F2EL35_HORVV|nr:uncharacterized protein LOC123424660 [Hordeum vulgare subsp. vulgare]BAK08057.1 predicted protein [Hordeum vulgare subsp. vulgare]
MSLQAATHGGSVAPAAGALPGLRRGQLCVQLQMTVICCLHHGNQAAERGRRAESGPRGEPRGPGPGGRDDAEARGGGGALRTWTNLAMVEALLSFP